MEQWQPQSLKQLSKDDTFYLRGDKMSRLETFVAAAFAFAVTLIMISGDEIPTTVDAIQEAVKLAPAFAFSVFQIMWIWYEHALWSRRFGLEDAMSIFLSGLLIIIVLIYIYPLKLMSEGALRWVSQGYFPATLDINSFDELRFMFHFFSLGFAGIALVFVLMYFHVWKKRTELCLDVVEEYTVKTHNIAWLVILATCLLAFILTGIVPDKYTPMVGLMFSSLGISMPILHVLRNRNCPSLG